MNQAHGRPLILVADDEPSISGLICDTLEEAGFETATAGDGEELIALALQRPPHLIVLDIVMPKLDGYAALTHLRKHPLTRDIPVITLTGQSDPRLQTVSAALGVVAHLTKPFSALQLAQTVRRLLSARPA